uniref:Secreted protein n=1 Tax=Cacopsylla melanoneura TaxID=428564 RepID=A0A8D8LZU5_9HEMI
MVLMIPLIVFMTILMKSQTLMHHICCYVCENSWMGENKWTGFISTQERHRIHPDKNIGTPYEDYCKVVNRLTGRQCYYGKELYQCYVWTCEDRYKGIKGEGNYPNVKRGSSALSQSLRPFNHLLDNCGHWWRQQPGNKSSCLYCDSDLCNDFSYSNRNLELNGLYDDFYLDKEKENLIMDTEIIPSHAPLGHGPTRIMIAVVVLKSILEIAMVTRES